jgi:hypothetical protein
MPCKHPNFKAKSCPARGTLNFAADRQVLKKALSRSLTCAAGMIKEGSVDAG